MSSTHSAARLFAVLALVAIAVLAISGGSPARAATFTVNTTDDELNSDGDCSLREAINAANLDEAVDACAAGSGADVITLPIGTYTLMIAGTDEDGNATGDLDVWDDLTINGAGAVGTIIDANGLDRALELFAPALASGAVAISGVTITGGDTTAATDDQGGGIFGNIGNADIGSLTITDSVITGNTAGDQGGGVFLNVGASTIDFAITNSTISNNSANDQGGGVFLNTGFDSTGSLTITDSTVSGNDSTDQGGGVFYNAGSGTNALTITGSTVSGNTADNDGAGVFFNSGAGGTLDVTDSTVADNTNTGTTGDGGGVFFDGGDLTIGGSAITGNTAGGDGGGLFIFNNSGTITNTTISGNTSEQFDSGGGIWVVGTLSLLNVTVAGNSAETVPLGAQAGVVGGNGFLVGGGIFNADANVTVKNTIIANNTGGDCGGGVTSDGHNLDSDGTCALAVTGDQSGVDPLLEALADNGGPTQTQALPADSPAVDTADNSGCPDTDQRAFPRPWDGDGDGTDTCDIGAYELIPDTDGDGILDAFDACINDPEDLDGVQDTDGCPEAEATPTPAQLPPTGGTPASGGNGFALTMAVLAAAIAMAGAGGALAAARRRR
jgi:CSLREA domain-containing protein